MFLGGIIIDNINSKFKELDEIIEKCILNMESKII